MLHDCRYNEIKILHDLSKLVWFIEKHCEKKAKSDCHEESCKTFDDLKKMLEQYIDELDQKL